MKTNSPHMDESQTQDQEPQREGNTGGCDEDLSSLLPEDPFAASLDQIASGQKTQYEVIGTLRSECQVIRERVDEVHRMVGDIANERETLRLANKELERLGDLHWQQRIVESMVSQLIPVYDLVLGFRAAHREESGKEADTFKAIQSLLLDFFGTQGIESYLPLKGTEFNPRLMKAIRVTPTADKRRHNRVRACLQAGFRWGRGAAIRASSVVLWRYQQPDQPQEDSN